MNYVKLKYQIVDFTGLIFSNDLSPPVSGGDKEGSWDAYYEGSIVFEIDTDWSPTEDFRVKLWVRVEDKGGNQQTRMLGE